MFIPVSILKREEKTKVPISVTSLTMKYKLKQEPVMAYPIS